MTTNPSLPSGITVRPACAEDFGAILELNGASVHFLSPLSRERLEQLHGQAALHLVAEDHGAIAGFLLAFRERARYDSVNYRWFATRFERFLYIDRVVVADRARGRGVGAMLYWAAFAQAASMDVPRVTCEFDVHPPNPVSARFHAKFGFREVGRQSAGGGKKLVSLQVVELAPASSGTGRPPPG